MKIIIYIYAKYYKYYSVTYKTVVDVVCAKLQYQIQVIMQCFAMCKIASEMHTNGCRKFQKTSANLKCYAMWFYLLKSTTCAQI